MWQIRPECSILIWKVFHRRRCLTWKLPAHPATAAPMLSPDLSTDGNLPRRTRLLSSLLSTSSPTQMLRPHHYASALTNALPSQLYNSYFYITAPRRPTNVSRLFAHLLFLLFMHKPVPSPPSQTVPALSLPLSRHPPKHPQAKTLTHLHRPSYNG